MILPISMFEFGLQNPLCSNPSFHYSLLLRCAKKLGNVKSLTAEWDHPQPTRKVLFLSHKDQQSESALWTHPLLCIAICLRRNFPPALYTPSQDWVRYHAFSLYPPPRVFAPPLLYLLSARGSHETIQRAVLTG